MQTEYQYAKLNLRTPFETAQGTRREIQQLFCRVKNHQTEGYGTALVLPHCTDDELHKKALDMALLDLLAKTQNVSLSEFLNIPSLAPAWSYITLNSLETFQLAKELETHRDCPGIKIKLRSEEDLNLIPHIRRNFAGSILIDANGCLSTAKVSALLSLVDQYHIAYVEQPFAKNQITKVAAAIKPIRSKLIADEDHLNIDDLESISTHYGAINVKLCKYNVINDALATIKKAKSMRLKIVLGCKTESELGISAMASLGGLADLFDLDGALELIADPFSGFDLKKGYLTLPNAPGIGVQLNSDDLFSSHNQPKGVSL